METETFSNYIEHTFLPNIPKERPVVLIYDGHSSHTSIVLIETALRKDIIILKLPPHTSHLLQIMDLAVFKPLKQMYDEALIKWQRRNYGTKLLQSIFSSIISQVWKELGSNHIRSGFSKAGIYPFCNAVIPVEKFEPEAFKRFQYHNSKKASLVRNRNDPGDTPQQEEMSENTSGSQATHLVRSTVLQYKQYLQNDNQNHALKRLPERNFFESILLEHVKQSPSNQQKRKKICSGAEIITHTDYLAKMKIQQDKKTVKSNKTERKRIKKKETQSDSSDDDQAFIEMRSDSDDDIDILRVPTPPIEEELHRAAMPDDFVLMKFPVKGGSNYIYYVAKILQCFDTEVKVSCLRKCIQNDGKYYFPNLPDISVEFKFQIELVLPKPLSFSQLTKRQ
ncbi:unnamed protein product [Diabrotica balteata]|uniref:DDE-1 domain-containing protein n=1 Tax=Diabrotica balteata TaxID=107213 RepID=A0A9P0GST1_DIABA|nr:unnamed protein product [Diabrotica balteata]